MSQTIPLKNNLNHPFNGVVVKPVLLFVSMNHSGSLTVLLDVHPSGALIMAIIPPAVFLGISFKIKSDTQIQIAAVMSILYAFLMMIAAIVIIGT